MFVPLLISFLFCLLLRQHLKTPPQSVVLVGHSMGGVVARALYTLPRFNPNLVDLIITQASPHLAPVLALDPFLLGRRSLPLSPWWGSTHNTVTSGYQTLACRLNLACSVHVAFMQHMYRYYLEEDLFNKYQRSPVCLTLSVSRCRFLFDGAAEVGQSGPQTEERHRCVSRGRLPRLPSALWPDLPAMSPRRPKQVVAGGKNTLVQTSL